MARATARMNTSTSEQAAQAVARLPSLREFRTDANGLAVHENSYTYVSSFFTSQRDIFALIIRVTGTTESG